MNRIDKAVNSLKKKLSSVAAIVAAVSLVVTGLVMASVGAFADPLDGVEGIIPDKNNPSGVTDKIYPGHGTSNPKGTLCGFAFVEAGNLNTRGILGIAKNNSGGFFNPTQGDIALPGVVVHALMLTDEGRVLPKQHGDKTQTLTAVTDDQGRYCFDFRPYGLDELGRGFKFGDHFKVWPEDVGQRDAYPEGLMPHFWNGAGRTIRYETATQTFLAQTALTADAGAGLTGNPYPGGAALGRIDGMNFSYKPRPTTDGSSSSGEVAKHLPPEKWSKPYGTDDQYQHLISLGKGKEKLSRIQIDWFDSAGKAPYSDAPTPDKTEHPWVCGYTYIDTKIEYNMFNRDGSENFLPNVRVLASIAESDNKGNIIGVRSTQVAKSDEMGRYCFVWKDWDSVASKRQGVGKAVKLMITAYPEELENFNYVPTVNPTANTWVEITYWDTVNINEIFSPSGYVRPITSKTEMRPWYEKQTSWTQVGTQFRIAPWFLGFAPSTAIADYSMGYGYPNQTIKTNTSAVLPEQAPYAIYWAPEGTDVTRLSSDGDKVADVKSEATGSSSATFQVPSDAKPGRYTMYLVTLNEDGSVKDGAIHDMDTFIVVKERGVYFDSADKRDSIRDYDLWNEKSDQITITTDNDKQKTIDNPYLLTDNPDTSLQVIEGYSGDSVYAFFRGIEEKDHEGVASGDEHNTYTLRMVSQQTTAPATVIKENIAGVIEDDGGDKLTLRADVDFTVPGAEPGMYEFQLVSASGEIVDRHPYKILRGGKVVVDDPKSAKQGATSPKITVSDTQPGHSYQLLFVDTAGAKTEIPINSSTFTLPADAEIGMGTVQLFDITDPDKPVYVAMDNLSVLDGTSPVIHGENVTKYSGQKVIIPVTVTDNVDTDLKATCSATATWLTWNSDTQQMEGTIPQDYPAGDVTITCQGVVDSAGNAAQTKTITVTVRDLPTQPTLDIDKSSVEQGDSVNAQVSAPEDGKIYEVQLFDPAGNPIGTKVTVTDSGADLSIPSDGENGTYTVKLFEQGSDEVIDTSDITVRDNTAPVISAPDSITVTSGQAIPEDVTITARDGVDGPVQPRVTFGPPGSGLSYDPATGKITGKAEKPGDYRITVTVKDSSGNERTKIIALRIDPDTEKPVFDPSEGLTDGKIIGKTGQDIKPVTVKASDDSGTVSLEVKPGTLPDGLNFNPDTGVISGKPKNVETGTMTIIAKDPSGNVEELEIPYEFSDGIAPTVTDPGSIEAKVDELYEKQIEATDDNGTVTCTAKNLPEGLSIDPATCKISGTPTAEAQGDTTVTVTDENDNSIDVVIPYEVKKDDGNGGATSTDSDNDGLSDEIENTICYDSSVVDGTGEIDCPADEKDQEKTDPNNPDTDGDGVPDGQEINDGTNPLNPDSFKDSDGDGVPDYIEEKDGTDPYNSNDYKDSDGDGVPDYVEEKDGTDPNDGDDYKDSDGDEVPDYVEEHKDGTDPYDGNDYKDSDGDGVPDYVEEKEGSDPFNPDSYKDTDKDGLPDYTERHTCYDKTSAEAVVIPCQTDDGKPHPNAAKTDPKNPDTDGDGVPDGTEVKNNTNPVNPHFPPNVDRPDTPKVKPSNGTDIDGTAPPGSKIEVWVDDRIVGEGVADENGKFHITLDKPLPPGTKLKVYAVDPDTGIRSKPAEGIVKVGEAPMAPGMGGIAGAGGTGLAVTGTNAGALNALGFLVVIAGLTLIAIRRRQTV